MVRKIWGENSEGREEEGAMEIECNVHSTEEVGGAISYAVQPEFHPTSGLTVLLPFRWAGEEVLSGVCQK